MATVKLDISTSQVIPFKMLNLCFRERWLRSMMLMLMPMPPGFAFSTLANHDR
jgi:hypothetical protein